MPVLCPPMLLENLRRLHESDDREIECLDICLKRSRKRKLLGLADFVLTVLAPISNQLDLQPVRVIQKIVKTWTYASWGDKPIESRDRVIPAMCIDAECAQLKVRLRRLKCVGIMLALINVT